MLRLQSLLAVPGPAPLGEVVHRGELDEGGEDEGEAHGDEPVHGGGVGNLGKGVPRTYTQCCHSKNSGDTWENTERKSDFFLFCTDD